MEALPRLPMLSLDLKHSPEYVEFGPTLKQYIKDHYGEDPTAYNKACTELEQLRQSAIQVSRDFMGCTTLKKYYAQLQYLQGRFPMADGGEAAIAFTWEDVQTGRDHVISDIRFEQACILYNLGCLHSLLGTVDTRHNAEGMKVSCTHFQCAAWAFEHLRDNFSTSSMSTDLSYELLSFHIILMLAQAQECILEKSMLDNRKSNITAKVAAQVVEFYKDASRLIDLADQKQQINSRMHKEWGRRLVMKAAFYQCITFYFLGRQAQESEKPGECLAYFTAARDELARATQLAKNEVPEVMDCLTFAKDVVMGKYESAKKDNDFVYHDKVPAIESLPEVKGASLVKGIPFDPNDKEISGPDIFQKLVPMEAHEASSVYSEEKAKLSRTIADEIDQKNMELEQFMSSIQIDMEQLAPRTELPESLLEKCAAMSVRTNAIKELTDSMTSVSGLATEVELSLGEIQQMIDDDNEKTEQFEKQYGKKNPSSVLPRLLEDLAGYRKRHEEGCQLNATLHKAMSTHTNNLKTLVLPPSEIQAMLPPSQPTLSSEDQDIVTDIRRLVQKVNEMKEQRKALHDQFRENIQKDDITSVLVTQEKADKESVFAEQLKKHDQVVGYIRQNLTAQDNILWHLTDTNAKYARIKQAYSEANARREKVVQDLIFSFEKYEELLAKSQKGSEYYKKLLQNVTKTLERCQSECKVRQEERDMLVAKFAPKAPPPSRPLAPKPDLSSSGTTPATAIVPDATNFDAAALEDTAGARPLPLQPATLPAKFEGPKLKDYLPFMKPRSFGPKTPPVTALEDAVSQPPFVPADVPQFDSGDYNISQRFPGLDPNLASVLPATIAQYLASVSSSGMSVAGGARHSPSHSPSPQRSSTQTPPRLATPPPPPSSAIFQGPQPHVPPTAYPSTAHADRTQPAVPHGYSEMVPGQNLPAPQMLPQAVAFSTASSTHTQQLHFAQSIISPAGGASAAQQYQHYGCISGLAHPHQYPNVSRHASTATVSAVNQPIISPGQESKNQAPVAFQQHPHPFPPAQPQQQPQPKMSLPPAQHFRHAGGTPPPMQQHYGSVPMPASSTYSQSFPQQVPQQQLPQDQFTGTGQHVASVQGQIPPGQSTQTAPSLATSYPSQAYVAAGHGLQAQGLQQQMSAQQYQPNQQVPQGPAKMPGQPDPSQFHSSYMQTPGRQLQTGLYAGVPLEMGGAGLNLGPKQQMGAPGGQAPIGSQQMGAPGGQPPIGSQQMGPVNEADQHGMAAYQSSSPHQSPSKKVLLGQGFEEVPVTSVGYRYVRGQHQGPFTADYAYPSQQLYQNVEAAGYQPTQPYAGGYQHSIDKSYQNAQTFGNLTSKAFVYGQSNQTGPGQPQNYSAQSIPSQGQGRSLQIQNSQQPVQGSLIQSHVQGQKFQDQGQGLQLQTQVAGHQFQGQTPGLQMQTQVHGQIQGPQMHGQVQGQILRPQVQSQVQGQILGPQVQGQVQGQILGPQVQGQVQSQIQGPQVQGQVQGLQMKGQFQGQVPGGMVQYPVQGSQPVLQPQQVPSQMSFHRPQLPHQAPPQQQISAQQFPLPHQQQQLPQQGFHQLPGTIPHTQQQQNFQPLQQPMMQPHQQQMIQPHQQQQVLQPHQQQQVVQPHQQQQVIQPPQQQQILQPPQQQQILQPPQQQQILQPPQQQQILQPPQQQQILQPQQGMQQPLGPYNPQQQLPIHGSASQLPAVQHPVTATNIGSMQMPLQPTNVSGIGKPLGQVMSRPSTPGSQVPSNAPPTPTSPTDSKRSVSRQSSSLDDILSSSPNGVNDNIITPQVLTDQERQLQKEEALKNLAIVPASEPYASQGALNKLLADVETFGKFVDELSVTILGVSRLDTVWKSLLDSQDVAVKKQSMAIARCYPMKNRDPDIMPYDETRVVLTTTKDDYINASWLNDLAPSCPKFITTQAPMPLTMGEFWAMVYEQGSEVLVQITSEYETGKKYPVYYPVEKDKPLEQGSMLLSLQSVKFRQHWVERILYFKNAQSKQGRTLVHLQFKNWPVSGFPDEISSIVHFISEVHTFYMQQRSLTKPIIVHCGFGIGRTGVFILIYTAMQEILRGNGLVDLPGLARRMLQKRRGIIHKKEQLRCCYDAVLCFAEEYLQKRGVLVKNPHFDFSKKQPTKVSPKHQASQPALDDIVLGTVDLQTIRENVGRLHVHSDVEKEKKDDTMGLTDLSFSKKSLESLSSISNGSLPDVVQRYSDTHSSIEQGKLAGDGGSRHGSDPNISSLQGLQNSSLIDQPMNSGPQSLPCPQLSPTDNSTTQASKQDESAVTAGGNIPFSLAQLQDPATFTMGSPDASKRSKITKANFHQSQGTLQTTQHDPDDPLCSLDPMWSLTKK